MVLLNLKQMKKLNFILLSFLFCNIFLNAQNNNSSEVIDYVDSPPEFTGDFQLFIKNNLKYPKKAKSLGIEGKVFIEFIVEKNGTLNDFKILKNIGYGCGEEALRVLKMSPKWEPEIQKGKTIRTKMTIPISFKIKDNTQSNKKLNTDEEVKIMAEKMPEFPGGTKEFIKYLAANLKYPRKARESGIEGRVFIEFIVEKNGALSNIKVVKGIESSCDNESVRVLQNSPKWKAGTQKGLPVRVKMSIPIVFKLNHNSHNIEKRPLVILNEKEISMEEFEKIIPNDIEYIEVIKADKAIEKYGKKAKDGVIEIYLKEKEQTIRKDDKLYLMAETQPRFPEGNDVFYRYIQNNLKVKNEDERTGKIFVEFIVEKKGNLSNVKIIRELKGVETNIVEVLENSPKWIAGMQRGVTVRVKMSIPIDIRLDAKQFDTNLKNEILTSIYPNPASDLVNIKIKLDIDTKCKISVFNSKSEEIGIILTSKVLEGGTHFFEWHTKDIMSGVYLIKIEQGKGVITKKVILTK